MTATTRGKLLARLLRESHERQFAGEDYQAATFDMFQEHHLTEDELKHVESAPDPDCDCGFCATAEWQD